MSKSGNMHEKFNDEVVRVIIYAKAASIDALVDGIYAESFVVGVLTSGANQATGILLEMNLDLEKCLKVFKKELSTRHQHVETDDDSYKTLKVAKDVHEACTYANELSEEYGEDTIGVHHILLAMLSDNASIIEIFEKEGLDIEEYEKRVKSTKSVAAVKKSPSRAATKTSSALDAFCVNVTDSARNNELDPIIAREKEIENTITILCRRSKNNPILIGEPGVGKTAIVEGIAQRIISGTVPDHIKGCELYSLNVSSLVAGTKYRGEFEERMEVLVKEIKTSKNCILFVDEIHTLVGAGGGTAGALDASNILKPFLARGEIRCIGATTLEDYKKYFQKDGALVRRFQQVTVEEPNEDQTSQILHGIKERLEEYHSCIISEDAIDAAIHLTDRYQPTKNFPDKAIDCLDVTCAKHAWDERKEEQPVIIMGDIAAVVSEQTGIPVEIMLWDSYERIKKIKETLSSRVMGQDYAIDVVCRALKNTYSGIRNPDKPIGNFIFGGASGTGKTYMSKELAIAIFGKESSFIRLDMSEFSEPHSVSKLVGSPPGYVGFRETDVFIDKVVRKPYSIVLLDEMEKASPEVMKLFLQVMSDGVMTDAMGIEVNFKNVILIMTGNFGMNAAAKPSLGFDTDATKTVFGQDQDRLVGYCRNRFGEEFVNRVDEFIPFSPLDDSSLEKIADMQFAELAERVKDRKFKLNFSDGVSSFMVKKSKEAHGINAGSLNRVISKDVEPCIADALMSVGAQELESLTVFVKGDELSCRTRKKRKSVKSVKKDK